MLKLYSIYCFAVSANAPLHPLWLRWLTTYHTGHAAFTERGAIGLPGLRVHAVHHFDCVLELFALNLIL